MAQASTSGGEKAASLVPKALRAKRWRLSVNRACQPNRRPVGFCHEFMTQTQQGIFR